MKDLNVKIEYIYNSGFTVETTNHFLIFDYYKGDFQFKDKKTFVFATHGHADHYTTKIFNWRTPKREINYILSSDIELEQIDHTNVHILSPYKSLKLDNIEVKAFGSTDLGLSFLVKVDDMTIFHAGDLNWWYWDDDPEDEKSSMEKAFKKKISRLEDVDIDISFFPVDPRLGEYYGLGGEYFINEIKPRYFIPMHFGDKYETTKSFIHKMKDCPTTIVEITKENQIINI